MLQQGFLAVLEAKTSDELRDLFVDFGSERGFERVGALSVVERPDSEPVCIALNNMPAEYVKLAGERERGLRDPVIEHCKRSSVPITWSQDTYTQRGLGSQWEEQEPFGYGNGIALALHL